MQATARLPNAVANAVLQEAYLLLHPPKAFHSAQGMLKANADRRDRPMARVLRRREFPPRRFFLRGDDGEAVEEKALEAPLLIETTPVREGSACAFSKAVIRGLPFRRGPQATHGTAFIEHEEGLERVALLRAAVVCLLGLGSGRAMDRSLRALRPNRGGCGSPPVLWAASMTAHS